MLLNNLFLAVALLGNLYTTAQIGNSNLGILTLGTTVIAEERPIGQSNFPVCSPVNYYCNSAASVVYRFTGNGKWTEPQNWLSNIAPPRTLPSGYEIIIDPPAGGECILNVNQIIRTGAVLKVLPGKRLRVREGVLIEE